MKSNNSKIIFSKGNIYYNDLQFYFIPLNSFIILLKKIEENESVEKLKEILKNSSIYDTQILYSKLNSMNLNKKEKIEHFLHCINTLGIGELKLNLLSSTRIIFSSNKVLSTLYYDLFSKKPKLNFEVIFEGYIENYLTLLFNKNAISNTQIVNNKIIFEIVFEQNSKINLKKEPDKKYLSYKENPYNTLTKKIVLNEHIKIKNGFLTIWNVGAVMTPAYYFINLVSKLNLEKYISIFESLGVAQGCSAVDLQLKVFGLNFDSEILFKTVIEQSELIGMGICKIEIQNKDKLKFYFENSLEDFFKDQYLNYEYELLDIYFKNLIRGVYQKVFDITTKVEVNDNSWTLITTKNSLILNKEEEKMFEFLTTKSLIKYF